jgi:hypothetical protein
VDALLSDVGRVTVIDNFSTGRPQNLSHVNNSAEIIPRFYGRILVVETRDVHIDIGTPESLARAQAHHT